MLLPDLPPQLQEAATAVMTCAPSRVVMLADMTQRATQPRFYVLDLSDRSRPVVVLATQVSHGYGSDPKRTGLAQQFGRVEGSGMTSLGLYRIGQPYVGKHGPSYHLEGLQASNANAAARAIELHPAAYVSASGAGRSAGCAAVAPSVLPALENRFGTLTGGMLYVAGPGAVVPSCAALATTAWPIHRPTWLGPVGRGCVA